MIYHFKFTNMRLWLDDTRDPPDGNWYIAKNYEDFKLCIRFFKPFDLISFDHDLGEDESIDRVNRGMSKRKSRALKKEAKNGLDCAKFLIKYCQDNKLKLPNYQVHSMNPVGKQNILSLLDNFKRFQDENNDSKRKNSSN